MVWFFYITNLLHFSSAFSKQNNALKTNEWERGVQHSHLVQHSVSHSAPIATSGMTISRREPHFSTSIAALLTDI